MAIIKIPNNKTEEQVKTTKYFAHYTNLQAACSIIRHGELRFKFGSMLGANDPRETKYWQFYTRTGHHQTISCQLLHERKISEAIKQSIACLSFAMDELQTNDKENLLGVNWYASYCRPRMWAQYADNHKGVCILFDKMQLLQCVENQVNELNIGDIYHGVVDYFDGGETPAHAKDEFPLNITDIEAENSAVIEQQIFTVEHIQAYLFRKHSDWANEAEYRLLIHKAPKYEKKYANIQCRKAMHTVILGVDCPENDWRQELTDLCREHRIAYKGIRWTNGYPNDDLRINYIPE